jgi:hypothetical protein
MHVCPSLPLCHLSICPAEFDTFYSSDRLLSAGIGTVQSFILFEGLTGAVKSALALLSVLNGPHFDHDLLVRRRSVIQRQLTGSAVQALGGKVAKKGRTRICRCPLSFR